MLQSREFLLAHYSEAHFSIMIVSGVESKELFTDASVVQSTEVTCRETHMVRVRVMVRVTPVENL